MTEPDVSFPTESSGIQVARKALCLLATLGLLVAATQAQATVGREQDIVGLRLGQRVKVDDGSCPAGQIKEVSGAKMTSTGIVWERKCIPRVGPKQK
ncbi:DUF6719 family protein [Bradyrhizobium sp.]|jgi:hypothetical protein|uniref:DUF6719 family protein n=1 Tax=Bradyrhizobium sp. TaxID=376 RepID=UPI003C5AAD2B